MTPRFVLALVASGCTLGGTGKPPGADDQGSGVDHGACAVALAAAPLAPVANFDVHDALPTATRNTWNVTSLPQPGDAAYPGGHYRTLAPDSAGAAHPRRTTPNLMYTPPTIGGYQSAAREVPFPAGTTEDTSKPIALL